jgi:hypothetical protein
MKRKLTAILVCVLSLVGCDNDVQKPDTREKGVTVETHRGPATLTDVKRDDERKELTAHVAGTQFSATLRIVPAGDGVVMSGGTAMLIDASGKLLYSIEITINEETNEIVYRQATEDNYMVSSILEQSDRVQESYDIDGDRASFEYPQLPYDTQSRTLNQVQHGLPTDHLSPDMREYAAQAQAFQAYYLAHANNSLRDNEAGELLVQLLSSPVTSNALIGEQPDEQMNRFIQSFCTLISACAAFTCRLLPTSAICSACTGGVLACAIFQALGPWFWGIQ